MKKEAIKIDWPQPEKIRRQMSAAGAPSLAPLAEHLPKITEAPTDFWERYTSHSQTFRRLWNVYITPLQTTSQAMPLLPTPQNLSVQVTQDRRYRTEGKEREWEKHCYFCYTLEGTGGFSDDSGDYRLSPGQGFLVEINDARINYFYPPEARDPWKFLAFEFLGMTAQAMVRGLTQRYGSVFALPLHTPILQRLLAFGKGTGGMYSSAHPHPIDGAELVTAVLYTVAGAARAREQTDAAMDTVAQSLQIIGSAPEAGLSVAELAAQVGVSRERLARAFRQRLDRTPQEVMQDQRIRRACFHLKDSDMPIKQIAARLGYTDYTNFIRAFRQVMGVTPHEFRVHGSIETPKQFVWHGGSADDTSGGNP